MNRKSGMRNTIYRMIEVLYLLEIMDLIDWDIYWAAQVAYDAYYKGLEEVRDEK